MLFKTFWEGIKIRAKAALISSEKGQLEVLDTDSKLYYHNGTTAKPVITEHVVDINLAGPFTNDSTVPSSKAVKAALDSGTTDLNAHINDTTDAHNSTAITNTPANGIVAITTQAAVDELQVNALAHVNSLTAHTAANLVNVPTGNLAATNVQSALNELQSDIDTRAQADKLIDTVTKIVDFTDNTKVIKFDAAGTTGTNTTIASSQTVNRVLTLPDSDGNIATETYADQTAIKYSIVLS